MSGITDAHNCYDRSGECYDPKDYGPQRCDTPRCRRPATHAHWLPWVNGAERVVLACAKCDPSGYYLELDHDSVDHVLASKHDGSRAAWMLRRRLESGR